MNGTKEVLIPLMDGVVTQLDRKKKIMTIQAPAGLIELYIG
jgi:ribosomal 30S subunit maturation factor RimM